ncbi:MAG TPA: AMP-binding protein [Thermoanaerobaculia bacterium]|nr:AMP-binding protein [Thermoanaerobaculia bacterium]
MPSPWLHHYDPGVPLAIDSYPDKTLVDFVAEHARQRPDAIALAFKGRHLSFREIDQASDSFAQGLAKLGLKRGDRVALVLPNCPQFVIAELAVWKLGGLVIPQNPIYTERELEQSLGTTRPRAIIVLTPFYGHIKAIQSRTSLELVIATNIKEYLPGILRFLFTVVKEKKEGHRIALQAGDHWFQDVLTAGAALGNPVAVARPDDPAMILMSGGTTGTPKGVLGVHRGLVAAGTQLLAWLNEPLIGPKASIMLPLPLFHTYGFAGAQSMTLMRGIPLILVPNPRDLGDVLATINRESPALFCGVPTLFTALLGRPEVASEKIDFRSIKACFSGAAPLMAETKKRFESLTGGRIVEGYSLTEATMACCANPYRGANKVGSVGMPLPDVTVRIVDADDGSREMPTGEIGEIVIHAPELMTGYWNNPAETSEVLRPDAAGRIWLYTGDLGTLDEEGYLFIVDRKKDLIKTSGFQVWPREIEEVLASHPAVAEAGAAGMPDERKGEVVYAWIVLRSDAADVDAETLRTFCKDKLAPYKVPAHIEFRKDLPKTMVGKVLRRTLVAEAKAAGA